VDIMKNVGKVLGWIITLPFQAGVGLILALAFSAINEFVIKSNLNTYPGWILSILALALGFWGGICGVGWISLRLHKMNNPAQFNVRMLATAGGVLLPFIILVRIGMSNNIADSTAFHTNVLDSWQPLLSQIAMVLGLITFYVSAWVVKKPMAVPTPAASQLKRGKKGKRSPARR
jgi:hypothetical protein